jgi:hypothetical protein
MNEITNRIDCVIAAIDAANGRDPTVTVDEGAQVPAELAYGQRMTRALTRMIPDASEHLRIAVRGQHVERWTVPRTSYPEGKAGYYRWRNELKDYHARRLGALMAECGYGDDDIARVRALVRKERAREDAEAQAVEDVACVVFLEHYLDAFMARTPVEKMPVILAKTWKKMSEQGHAHALRLPLPAEVPVLLQQGLKQLDEGGKV